MAPRVDHALVAAVLDGDPLLLPEEAAALLGIDEDELTIRARAGLIASVQVIPETGSRPGGRGVRRYRKSVITEAAAR